MTWTRGILHCDINSAQLKNATEFPQVPRLSLYTLTYVTGRCRLQSSPLPSLYYGSSVFATTGSRDEADFLEPSVGRSAIVPEFRGKGKGESRPRTGHEGHRGSRDTALLFL